MLEEQVYVGGRFGLNGYRSALVATTASRFVSDITCTSHGKAVNAKDVMSVMTLCAPSGTVIRITAIGPDEALAARALVSVLSADDTV
ncbi:TPA: HPr family phosphocarrier protein [Burkholderia aenigmatica]|uniref:HPr family phosphocarrier protein n=1 Tax=Burkholderia sp. AU45251 TaxID=3059204 RepID=UPI0026516B71|nr:HPr family phosphocarrier protein [Burkholderia sp. AU45251]HDR9482119.1 HPr family phosphocarrier protein [Burkholderia aenigmatica]MDN7515246.1 HPr family phosphocarrier protein [Burkholderia sp. AU45251]HDR9515586.1 HPr family phosphocarrier protein [Burkholderia aenigmatica]HDR9590490.1 HPr family phosphocarrier protein [Burkholderia aenigmatica]HDR9598863.1 HPr family phosphocarrier protein [Burkholderia aenigmatica]